MIFHEIMKTSGVCLLHAILNLAFLLRRSEIIKRIISRGVVPPPPHYFIHLDVIVVRLRELVVIPMHEMQQT